MKCQNRRVWRTAARILLFAVLLTTLFPLAAGAHNCTHECCVICAALRSFPHLFLGGGIFPVFVPLRLMLSARMALSCIAVSVLRHADTPVSFFDKLSD